MKKIILKIRFFVRKVINILCFFFSKNFFKLLTLKNKIILIDTPIYGNLGDHAITVSEILFLKKQLNKSFVEITHYEYKNYKKFFKSFIKENDVLAIQGGGFVGNLWQNEQDVFLDILNSFSTSRIIVFPQTIYFEESEISDYQKQELVNTLKRCSNLYFFAREKRTFQFLEQNGIENRYLVPDIVTYLKFNFRYERDGVLFCMRKDKEKNVDESFIKNVECVLKEKGFNLYFSDTVVNKNISKHQREKYVFSKLKDFSKYKLVVTDRLHGMLFSVITSTPCIFFDNLSGKSKGTYEWIKYIEYLKFNPSIDEIKISIEGDFCKEAFEYTNSPLVKYYKLIENVFKG